MYTYIFQKYTSNPYSILNKHFEWLMLYLYIIIIIFNKISNQHFWMADIITNLNFTLSLNVN